MMYMHLCLNNAVHLHCKSLNFTNKLHISNLNTFNMTIKIFKLGMKYFINERTDLMAYPKLYSSYYHEIVITSDPDDIVNNLIGITGVK
jgi:hypothetical protein